MKLSTIASRGDRLETLKQLRKKIAQTIDESKSGRDISSLARQLQLVMIEIEKLEKDREVNPPDELTVLDLVRAKHAKQIKEFQDHVSQEVNEDYEE